MESDQEDQVVSRPVSLYWYCRLVEQLSLPLQVNVTLPSAVGVGQPTWTVGSSVSEEHSPISKASDHIPGSHPLFGPFPVTSYRTWYGHSG